MIPKKYVTELKIYKDFRTANNAMKVFVHENRLGVRTVSRLNLEVKIELPHMHYIVKFIGLKGDTDKVRGLLPDTVHIDEGVSEVKELRAMFVNRGVIVN